MLMNLRKTIEMNWVVQFSGLLYYQSLENMGQDLQDALPHSSKNSHYPKDKIASAGRIWRREALDTLSGRISIWHNNPTAPYFAKDIETSTLSCLPSLVHSSQEVKSKLSNHMMKT